MVYLLLSLFRLPDLTRMRAAVVVVHGSGNNVSPHDRAIFYLNYNAVSNRCIREPGAPPTPGRHWWHCNLDTTPLQSLDDGCLLAEGVRGAKL
jgi:hypothetical protein